MAGQATAAQTNDHGGGDIRLSLGVIVGALIIAAVVGSVSYLFVEVIDLGKKQSAGEAVQKYVVERMNSFETKLDRVIDAVGAKKP